MIYLFFPQNGETAPGGGAQDTFHKKRTRCRARNAKQGMRSLSPM